MLKDGEKYACAACIRGHRVSSCQHADRELHHINKKGRPVSQCHHCRGLRKSRAAHVRCDCGEHQHHDGNGVTTESKDDLCACSTGARCTCAFKKDLLELDENYKIHKPVHHKPGFPNRKSEGAVPRARNGGHHPPLHRQNNAAHQFGIPYTIRRLHSDEMSPQLPPTSDYNPNMDLESMVAANQPINLTFAPSSPYDTRLTRSAHASPLLGPVPDISDDPLSRDFSAEFQASVPFSFLNTGNPFSSNSQRHSIHDFSAFNLDDLGFSDFNANNNNNTATSNTSNPAPLSVTDELGVDWSHISIPQPFDNNDPSLNTLYPQPPSNASMDYSASGRPDLSHSSSGTASDQGDPRRFAEFGGPPHQHKHQHQHQHQHPHPLPPTSSINIAPRSFALDPAGDFGGGAPYGLSQSLPHGFQANTGGSGGGGGSDAFAGFGLEDLNLPTMDLLPGSAGVFDVGPGKSVGAGAGAGFDVRDLGLGLGLGLDGSGAGANAGRPGRGSEEGDVDIDGEGDGDGDGNGNGNRAMRTERFPSLAMPSTDEDEDEDADADEDGRDESEDPVWGRMGSQDLSFDVGFGTAGGGEFETVFPGFGIGAGKKQSQGQGQGQGQGLGQGGLFVGDVGGGGNGWV